MIKFRQNGVVDPWHFDQISSKWQKKYWGWPMTFWSNFLKMFKFCVVDPSKFYQISSKCQKNIEVGSWKFPKFEYMKICAKLLKIRGLVLVIIAKFNQKYDLNFVEKCLFFQRIDAYKGLHWFFAHIDHFDWKKQWKCNHWWYSVFSKIKYN